MKDKDRTTTDYDLVKDNKIDLLELLRTIWVNRATIIKILIFFGFFGLFVALFSRKEYTSSTIMVPQVENQPSNLRGLSSIASLAGFNMDINSGQAAISPVLYPEIIASVGFQLEIMNAEYEFEELKEPTSLLEYYVNIYKPGLFEFIKQYTIGLPGLIRSAIQREQLEKIDDENSEILRLTVDQNEVREIIDENTSLVVNDLDGSLTLTCRFHQAYLSAQIAKKTQELLQEYVTRFKIEKASAQLEFIKVRYEESRRRFEDSQSKLASFRDANKNISSEIMRTHEERLQNEYQLAFEVYSELAKQYEQSMIQVKEDTPVFSVIKEVVVPIEKSKPNRSLIIIVWFILGGIIGVIWTFAVKYIKSIWIE